MVHVFGKLSVEHESASRLILAACCFDPCYVCCVVPAYEIQGGCLASVTVTQ